MIRVNFQHFIRAVVLAVFAIYFIGLHITGDITKYINPKYDGMSKSRSNHLQWKCNYP